MRPGPPLPHPPRGALRSVPNAVLPVGARRCAAVCRYSTQPWCVPPAPSSVSVHAKASGGSVVVSWPAAVDPQLPVISYTVSVVPEWDAVGVVAAPGTSLTVGAPQLTPGYAYTFAVVANNAYGPSMPSPTSASVTMPGGNSPSHAARDAAIGVLVPVAVLAAAGGLWYWRRRRGSAWRVGSGGVGGKVVTSTGSYNAV
jgi:hypothetical protein